MATSTEIPVSDAQDYYFDSYAYYGIHESMLKDTVRTRSYQEAFYRNPHLVENKVVLDVGCGTGILSLFAARCGARKVYAVECSSIAEQARAVVKENQLENIITVVQGKLEEITLPEKVDLIVSEWMGYFLLYESMMNSVLTARNRFGAEKVRILPDRATLYLAGIEDQHYWERKTTYWEDIYGFNYQCVRRQAILEPLVDVVNKEQIISNVSKLITFDLNTVEIADLSFEAPFQLTFTRDDIMHAIQAHFDTLFSLHDSVLLSTSPYGTSTHWKQTVFYLQEPLRVCKGEVLRGTLSCRPNAMNHRDLDIQLSFEFRGRRDSYKVLQDYRLR
eukprot:CAMPEP_0201486908 /NCGR_PEP_ID=MMETSP0151_2-20130828/10938_1 /ASSEMBLY_ACC=CAM_ASM_000257 /TAXON_ID=200890 /ORGANISM="Paramoeba atlantica, Strain 621/1 / CCAP 1560/9" /LENGTH=332 /DNA_ID=CAMNT_0047871775 /DNA_START=137 /DNA_END=1135 /DNA_ORIENTATION=+